MNPRATISNLLREGRSFLVTAHVNPDGDAVGSMSAMGWIVRSLGKECVLYNPSGIPEKFDWLDLPCPVLERADPEAHDWTVVLDCGAGDRLGEDLERRLIPERTINIDHHLGNPHFGRINWVEQDRSSVGEMMALLAQDLRVGLGGALGEAVYLAVYTDTGGFCYSNTRPETLRVAAALLEHGLDLDRFNARLHSQWSLNRLHLHGLAIQGARLYAGGRIGVISASRRAMQATETDSEDCEGLVNYVRQIRGVVVAASLREEAEPQRIKFSLRSWGDVNVRAIAAELGGGGHHNAAGGTLDMDLDGAERTLVAHIRAQVETLGFSGRTEEPDRTVIGGAGTRP
jgi:phosphoesterase RecJ-like protein